MARRYDMIGRTKISPSLVSPRRRNLFRFVSVNNVSPIDSHNILNSHYARVILAVLKLVRAAG